MWLNAILDYVEKVKSSISLVAPSLCQNIVNPYTFFYTSTMNGINIDRSRVFLVRHKAYV